MSTITPYNLLTGRNTAHRDHFAQLGDLVWIINGHDGNKVLDMRTGQAVDLGMTPPAAAPVVAAGAAGNVTGTVRYRARWCDQSTGTYSLPGAEATITTTDTLVSVTKPTGTPAARVTHWIIERTTNGGRTWWPVNRDSSNPYGTAIGTGSYSDNVSDGTLRNRQGIPEAQGVIPADYRFPWSSRGRIFAGGRATHVVSAYLTNGSTSVTSGSGFLAVQIGRDMAVVGDTDGKTYRITAVPTAAALTLATAYAGTTGTKTIAISGPGDRLCWTEPFEPESGGSQGVTGLDNRLTIGDDGEALRGGCALGDAGELIAKRTRLFLLHWSENPDPVLGDGRLVSLPVRRGCVGPLSLRYINGYAYGMDFRGIWRMSPGGLPQEIGNPIANEWKRTANLNWLKQDNWHIGYDPANRQVWFFVCENSDTYPRRAWIWDEEAEVWLGSRTFNLGCTCTIELPDTKGIPRMVTYFEASGSAASYARMQGLGTSRGANAALRSGTVTGGDATSLACTGAGWTNDLGGCAITLIRANRTEETQTVVSNTSDTLTTTAFAGVVPKAGDTFRLGEIPARYRTGRITGGDASRKKQFTEVWVWTKYKTAAVPFTIKARFDGQAAPNTDFQTLDEDGITATAGISGHTVDPTVFRHRFRVPLHELWHTDMQLEIMSDAAGDPWEIMAMKVLYRWDDAEKPRDK